MAHFTVMGAGIMGLATAFVLARRGASVRVVERTRVGAGSSGGLVGALAPHVPEQWNAKKAFQLDSLLMAEGFWAEVRQIGGVDPGYARLGRVQPLADDAAVARAHERAEGARALWQGRAEWRVVPASEVPGLRIASPTGFVIFDTLTARLSPRGAGRALVAALAAMGVAIEAGERAPEGGAVLWATGAQGLADLSADLGYTVGAPIKGQAALLDADWRDAPQLFVEGIHVIPHADGTTAIGSTTERDFDSPDTTDAQIEAILDQVRIAVPELAGARVLERWAGLRPRSRTRAPMLGPWPGRPGHVVLNGGFKIGFGMAPKLAHLAADLLLTGAAEIPDGFHLADNLRK
ncbi:MAG: FAD-binding oxidoreductase [Rhodobacter sp.]|nr:FAD-binding oxidoreductase [Paracoccaceae bacterium]MCC0077678.1 FAD-binding oxidoreductase [Rhodobacter sp.]